MGWWNPNVRSSIVRVPLMKLMGTGIASALLALSPHVGRYLGFSLALSAAVNFVASYFYYRIWQLRAQLFGGSKYDRWTAVVGRDVGTTAADEEGSLLKPASSKEQDEHDKHVIYWQETMVDGQRYSDWVCTLVLMTLDLGHLREYLTAVSGGFIPPMRISKEWTATLQAIMILFASVYRFSTNEARPRKDAKRMTGSSCDPCNGLQTPLLTAIISWGSFIASSGIFGVIVWVLLDGLPDASEVIVASVQYDLIVIRVLVLVWCLYPVVTLFARFAHWGVAGDEYLATWSTIKDVSFASLDIASKAGLAIFFVLKVTYVGAAEEATMLARANVTHV